MLSKVLKLGKESVVTRICQQTRQENDTKPREILAMRQALVYSRVSKVSGLQTLFQAQQAFLVGFYKCAYCGIGNCIRVSRDGKCPWDEEQGASARELAKKRKKQNQAKKYAETSNHIRYTEKGMLRSAGTRGLMATRRV